jgi:D-alanyl-D-alanine dipeptidase
VAPDSAKMVDLVDLAAADSRFRFDIRYATPRNFVGRAVYDEPRAFLQRTAAEALVRVLERLEPSGYGLLIFDGYRPWSVTRLFWELTPPHLRHFVADPAQGSKHNRGCAVDLALWDLALGTPARMPTDFDDFSPAAAARAPCPDPAARAHRALLRVTMESCGFVANPHEWWHFDFHAWADHPILDLPIGGVLAHGR